MHNISNWLQRYLAFAAFIVGLAGFSTPALADIYNIILKQNGTPLDCVTGGFTFTKTTLTGALDPESASLMMESNCINGEPGAAAIFDRGALKVIVQQVTINGLDQGLNVVGIRSGLNSVATGSGASRVYYNLLFTYTGPYEIATRTFTLTKITGTAATGGQTRTQVATGTYYVRNTAAVPEPETLFLVMVGAAGLMLARRRKLLVNP